MWTSGYEFWGQVGHNSTLRMGSWPTVPREAAGELGGSKAVMLSAGLSHSTVVTHDRSLWCCSLEEQGQLRVDDRAMRMAMVRVGTRESFRQWGALIVGCCSLHTMQVTEEGGLWSWDEGVLGRLGHNAEEDRPVPVRVDLEGLNGS